MNKTDGTKSLKHVPIWIRDAKNLLLSAKCWDGKVRIECNLNCPYLMNFMLDLSKQEALDFMEQIKVSIKDIKEE